MTEIPEHLLRRSRERREALGLATGDEGAATPPPHTRRRGDALHRGRAGCGRHAGARSRTGSPGCRRAAPEAAAALRRGGVATQAIPYWAIPVVALLPLWAFIYQWSLTPVTKAISGPLADGQELYTANCSPATSRRVPATRPVASASSSAMARSCQTFPDMADQIAFVKSGSEPSSASPTATPTGRVASTSARPACRRGARSSPTEEIDDVVCYERVVLSGQDPVPAELHHRGSRSRRRPPAGTDVPARPAATTSSWSAAVRPARPPRYWLARRATTSSSSRRRRSRGKRRAATV